MLAQGFVLLISGMGIVFAFLVVLVFAMSLMAKIVPRFNYVLPDPEPKKVAKKSAPASNDDASIALAIAVALQR